MSLMIVAFLAAQAAAPTQAIVPAVKKKQVCEMIEVTGSRSKRRVCRDENGSLDLGPGVRTGAPTSGMLRQGPSGSGEPLGQGMSPGG